MTLKTKELEDENKNIIEQIREGYSLEQTKNDLIKLEVLIKEDPCWIILRNQAELKGRNEREKELIEEFEKMIDNSRWVGLKYYEIKEDLKQQLQELKDKERKCK